MRNGLAIALVFAFSFFTAFAVDNSLVSVVARGMGATAKAALKDSFRDAVERAVGVFVDAEQQAENDQLICDQILTQSNAYIEHYRTISERKGENGLFEVKIVAKVKKSQLTRKLKDTMPTKTFSLGDDLIREYEERQKLKMEFEKQAKIDAERKLQEMAKKVSKEKRDTDAAALVKNTFTNFNPAAMMIDVTATGGKPIVEEKNGEMTVGFDLCLRLSTEKYFKTLLPRLKQLFGQIALETTTVNFILTRSDSELMIKDGGFFADETPNIVSLSIPAGSLWSSDVEIEGVACQLPVCQLLPILGDPSGASDIGGGRTAVVCQPPVITQLVYQGQMPIGEVPTCQSRPENLESTRSNGPSVWLVDDNITGSGERVRVTMIGYKLSDKCIAALEEVANVWSSQDETIPVEFVVELIDASGKVVTSQKFHVAQDCGWIGWGDGLKEGQDSAFYVMPWLAKIGYVSEKVLYYDERGNYLGNINGSTTIHRKVHMLIEVAPFRCKFKLLEEELKDVSTIRVRAGLNGRLSGR